MNERNRKKENGGGHSSSHKKPVPDCAPHLASGEAKATSFDFSNPLGPIPSECSTLPCLTVPNNSLNYYEMRRTQLRSVLLAYIHLLSIAQPLTRPIAIPSQKSKTKFSFHNPRALSFFMICLSSFFIR